MQWLGCPFEPYLTISQGQAGSDVAKEASDIVLTDDNFASILNAVEEGRRTFDNIKRFVLHVLAENIAQATTLLVGLAFKDAQNNSVYPLAPVQILWVIMATSGMPDMGLGMEKGESHPQSFIGKRQQLTFVRSCYGYHDSPTTQLEDGYIFLGAHHGHDRLRPLDERSLPILLPSCHVRLRRR